MQYLTISFLSFLLISCANFEVKVDETKYKQNIDTLIDTWHIDAANANFDSYMQVIETNGRYIGTDASENWSKQAFATFSKPYFDKGKAWDFKPLERNIYFNKTHTTAWFDELLTTWMGTCRGSGVLELVDDKWLIKHYVLSMTIPNEKVNQVIEITTMDSSSKK